MRFVIATLIALLAGVALLYLFATYLRRTSMFFPEHSEGQSSEAEDVWFPTSDGVRLHGWLFHAGAPLMIWFHGNAGDITSRAPMAAELAKRGISVLLFDYRGYGQSGGTPSEDDLYRDGEAAYAFAATRATDIVLYGESLGGPYAAHVAMKHHVGCVVIENSFPSLRALGNALYAPLPLGWFAPRAMLTTRWLNEAGVPVLVMHGRRDGVIPFALGRQLYDELRVPKTLFVSETAGHCEIPEVEGERYFDAVARFVRR
jgi:fermentation-respiration switch protein FrsA (DUF1100 family)